MASTSGARTDGVVGRIQNAASTLYQENNSLIVDIRKELTLMKEIGVDLERDNEFQKVKELEAAAIELLEISGECAHHSSAFEAIGNSYQPGTELTDFKKLLEGEVAKFKATSSSDPQKHPLFRQFREAVWNVHHAGEPMPGEEQDDIIMTSTQSSILNITCPLSGKPISELKDPVRSMECKHIYEKKVIMAYLLQNNRCPVAACPKKLQAAKVVCDPMLLVEIEELRSMSKEYVRTNVIEDFSDDDDEEEE